MRVKFIAAIFLTHLILTGCSDSNEYVESEQPSSIIEMGIYEEECHWIFGVMNHYYYWNEDLADSLSYDYTLTPVTFFRLLLSQKDRFSYCEQNNTRAGNQDLFPDAPFYDAWDTGKPLKKNLINNNGDNVLADSIYHADNHCIGYLCYQKFNDMDELVPVIRHFYTEKIDELVLDLRYNPGGLLVTSQYLATSIAPDSVYNQTFQVLQYNHRVSQELFREKGDSLTRYSFLQPTGPDYHLGTPLYGLNLQRVYILVSNRTASASEVMITCLRPYMDVIVIGERTVGKGVGMNTFSDSRYKYSLVPITFRYYNARMESTPDGGIEPDYEVPDGYNTPRRDIGRIDEPLLAKALELILEEANPDSIETTNH